MGMGRARSHRVGNLAAEVSAVAQGTSDPLARFHSLDSTRGAFLTELYTWFTQNPHRSDSYIRRDVHVSLVHSPRRPRVTRSFAMLNERCFLTEVYTRWF